MNLAELVEELVVQTWERDDHGERLERTGPALLQWLREAAFGANSGRTRSGGRDNPTPLNVTAFTLWEDITGQIAAQYVSATELRPHRAPEINLLAWWTVFSAAIARGETVLAQHELAGERLERWVTRIRDHFDPPWANELTVACPVCGLARVTTGVGELEVEQAALHVAVREGQLEVTCINPSCGARWRGDVEVINLGRLTGEPIDVDAIREARMPVGVREKEMA